MICKEAGLGPAAMSAVSALLLGFSFLLPGRAVAADGTPGADGASSTQTVTSGTATVTGGNGGNGTAGTAGFAGGVGGNAGSATLTSSGSLVSATVTGGSGGLGGNGGGQSTAGSGAAGGDGGSAAMTNSASISGAVTVTGGNGGLGGIGANSSGTAGSGGAGGAGGAAALINSGTIVGPTTVTGGAGGTGGGGGRGPSNNSTAGVGGAGGGATLSNAGTLGSVTVSGGAGGAGGDGGGALGGSQGGSGGAGGNGGNAVMTNTGSAGAIVVTGGTAGAGGAGGQGKFAGQGGAGGSASLVNSGSVASATVTGADGGAAGNGSGGGGGRPGGSGNAGGAGGNATISNTGSILGAAVVTAGNGGAAGVGGSAPANPGVGGAGGAGGNATLSNWGSILGGVTVTAGNGAAGGAGGNGNPAAANGVDGSATLNVYAGSRIVGAIALNGGARNLNFFGGNYVYTLNSLAGVNIAAPGSSFFVSGNTVYVVDPVLSGVGLTANVRALIDFTRGVSDAVPVFSGSVPGGGGAPLAFAGIEPPASSRFDDAFASLGLSSAYAGETMVFKAPTASYADGTTVWARSFAGQRIQQQEGALPRNTNLFYGGMIGGDFVFRQDLRVGVFLGGGQTRSRVDLNQGGTDSDLLFGGAYARYDVGASFLHGAVQAGASRNAMTRTVNNNLVANGLETARAAYDGWYVSPELSFGHRFALGRLADAAYTLTPSLRIRYLYGSFGGYSETGTVAPLTVGGQTFSALEERGELKLTRSVTINAQNQLSTSVAVGVLGTQRLGTSTVNAALFGQAIPLTAAGKTDVWGGFGGLGLEWRTRNVTLFSAAEYLALSDNSNVVSGRGGLRVGF